MALPPAKVATHPCIPTGCAYTQERLDVLERIRANADAPPVVSPGYEPVLKRRATIVVGDDPKPAPRRFSSF